MKTITEYLDDAKVVTGSDYRTAKRIGMTRAGISNSRKHGTISTNYALKLAELLNVNPTEIIAASDVKANPENRKFWVKWVSAAAIVSCVLMADSLFNSTAYAQPLNEHNIHYAYYAVGALILFMVYNLAFSWSRFNRTLRW